MLAANEVLGARILVADEVSDVGDGDRSSDRSKHVEPKTGRLKGQKSAKSQKSSKSKSEKSKKPLKNGNLLNFDAMEAGPSFLTSKARAAFNRLRPAFTKAPIFLHFDSEYYIWLETDASGYAISDVLSQPVFETRQDRVATKIDLG